jgi:hypothetical protein
VKAIDLLSGRPRLVLPAESFGRTSMLSCLRAFSLAVRRLPLLPPPRHEALAGLYRPWLVYIGLGWFTSGRSLAPAGLLQYALAYRYVGGGCRRVLLGWLSCSIHEASVYDDAGVDYGARWDPGAASFPRKQPCRTYVEDSF